MKSKVLTFIFSLVVAFGLWLYVITVVSPESEATFYNVPVVLQGEGELVNRGLMITSDKNPTVTLRIAGNRSDLNNLNSSNITVIADVSKIWEPGESALNYSVTYPGNIPNNALNIQNRNPDRITIKVEERITRNVPVEVIYVGDVEEIYIADKENLQLDVSAIMVKGPKAVVDRIHTARIQVNLEGQSQSIVERLEYVLCDAEGQPVDVALVETDVDAVGITLPILRLKEITLDVEVLPGGGATRETSEIILDMPTIMVSGSESLLENLEDTLIIGSIDLAKIDKDTELTFDIVLPEGVNNETGTTQVKVQVKFPGLATKTLRVTNIQAINVPEGMEATFITKELEVILRGPKSLMAKLRPEHVIVTADFQGAVQGTLRMKVTISFTPEFSQVGQMGGTYTVMATLRLPEPPEAQ